MHNNNDLAVTQKQLPQWAEKANNCIKRYGGMDDFFHTFRAETIPEYTRYPSRCVNGSAPSLAIASKAYGATPVRQWLATLLVYLSENIGVLKVMTPSQMQILADNILMEYPYLKPTEIMLFISYALRGKLGKMDNNGAFDPVTIMRRLDTFCSSYRTILIDEYESQQHEKERIEHDKRARDCREYVLQKLTQIIERDKI